VRAVLLVLVAALALAGCGGSEWDNAWETPDGDEVDEKVLSTGTGCPEDTVFLHLGWPFGTPAQLRAPPARQYIRDPSGYHVTGFDANAEVPDSARFSGYRRGDAELWLGRDADEFVYVVYDDHAERWPRSGYIGCD
jgi:hypothetical protein